MQATSRILTTGRSQAKDPRAVQQEARPGPPSGQRIADDSWPGGKPIRPNQAAPSSLSRRRSRAPPPVVQSLREFLTERVLSSQPEGDSQAAARTTALASSQLLGAARTR